MQGDRRPDGEPTRGSPASAHPPLPELPPPAAVLGGTAPPERPNPFAPDPTGHAPIGTADEPPLFASLRQSSESPSRKVPPPHRELEPAPVTPGGAADEDEVEERPTGVGVFFSDALFYLVLVIGLVLAGYTLARPFLGLPDAPFR